MTITPLIVAHRGASGSAPENTFSAFDRAVALGFPDIELDVHVSRDGVPVVIHDPTLDRTTDGHGAVAETPFAAIAALDAGAWFGAEFAGQRVPSLEAVFAAYVGRARFTVEIKAPNVGLEAKVLGLLTRYGMRSSSGICSFHASVLRELEPVTGGAMPIWLSVRALGCDAIVEALRLRASGIAAPIGTLTAELVDEATDRGLLVAVWPVDTKAQVQAAAGFALDRVYSNYPDQARAWFASGSPTPAEPGSALRVSQ